MTNIAFYKKNGLILGFEISGHTGKDDYGKDLLCCQISTIAQFAVVAIDEVGKIKNFHEVQDGYLKLMLSEKEAKDEKVQFVFRSCEESLKSIISDEKKYAKLEVRNV